MYKARLAKQYKEVGDFEGLAGAKGLEKLELNPSRVAGVEEETFIAADEDGNEALREQYVNDVEAEDLAGGGEAVGGEIEAAGAEE